MRRSVTGSVGRFLAIMGIVALGCGFFAGLVMSGPDMRSAADEWYDGTHLWDLRVISTLGFSGEDVARVSGIDGIQDVMPSRTLDAMADLGSSQGVVRVQSLDVDAAAGASETGSYVVSSEDGGYLNRVRLREGRLPQAAGECVALADAPKTQLAPGATVELTRATTDLDDLLRTTTLTVVGTVSSSNYPYTANFGSTTLGTGEVDQVLLVGPESFAEDAPYTEVYATVEGAAGTLSESDAYWDVVDPVKARLEEAEEPLSAARREDLRAQAQEELDERRADYEERRADAEAELDDAEAELAAALAELRQGEAEHAAGETEYESGLAEYEAQRDAASRQLDAAQAQVDESRARLEAGESDYQAGVAQLLAQMGTSTLEEATSAVDARAEELSQAQEASGQLQGTRAELDAAEAQYQEGLDEFLAQVGASSLEEAEALLGAGDPDAEGEGAGSPDVGGEGTPAAEGPSLEELQRQLEQAQATLAGLREARASDEEIQAAQLSVGQLQAAVALATLAQLRATRAELDAAEAQYQEGLGEFLAQAGATTLEGALASLEAAAQQLSQAQGALSQLSSARAELDAGWRQLSAGQAELDRQRASAEGQLADAAARLDSARAQLAEARAQLDAGWREYDVGLAEWQDGRREADERFATAERQLADAQRQVDDIEEPDIYVLDRGQSEGAATYHADTERMDHIASVFPLMFFLVAALVALTTMTRMVDDERVEIGTYKALGYSTSRIASKYLAYAGIASGVGAALGICLLSQVLPYIVIQSYAIIYAVPLLPFPLPIAPLTALAAGGAGVGITLIATWGAVVSSLRETPALLMLPRAPKAGKRILLEHIRPLWARVSFSWKVTLRNLFRYKRRLLMTVIGISGCAALLLVGFGLHDSIWDIIDKQYGPIVHYNAIVGLDDDAGELAVASVGDYLVRDGRATNVVRVQQENMQAGSGDYDGTIRTSVVIPRSADELASEISFRERVSGRAVRMDDDAVLVTEKLASLLGVSPGDTIRLFDQDGVGNAHGEGHDLTVTGVVENYVGNLVYVGRGAWRGVSGDEPAFSTFYAQVAGDEAEHERVEGELHGMDGVSTVTFSDETIETYRTMLTVVDGIVVVLIVCAGLLAFIVLYNLTNINIEERVREIASLKVLGFTRREVHAYVFREILILALMGDALGMVLGTWLETFTITAAEVDYVMFGRQIHLPSYLYAFAITMAFAVGIVWLMRRKLDRVSMVESLKSID